MRLDELKTRTHRKAADQEFKRICKEDGVFQFSGYLNSRPSASLASS